MYARDATNHMRNVLDGIKQASKASNTKGGKTCYHTRIKAKHERERARIQACQKQDKISYKQLHPTKGKDATKQDKTAQEVQTNTY